MKSTLTFSLTSLFLCFTLITKAQNTTLQSSDADNIICQTEEVTFTVAETGDNFQFLVNDVIVKDGAANTYTTSNLADNDIVKVIRTHDGGQMTTSNEISMTVHSRPTVEAGETFFQLQGAPITLNASTTGTTSQVSQWTLIDGTATIVESTNPNTVIQDIPLGTSATVLWTAINESCTISDSVSIYNLDANSMRRISSIVNNIREWKVPDGVNEVTAKMTGADGGNTNKKGGQGATAIATFTGISMDTLKYVLGQTGSNENGDGAGGGGGSGLRSGTDMLIIVGGGGGAAGDDRASIAQGGQIVPGNGQGGSSSNTKKAGGGGGGLFSNGVNKTSSIQGGKKGFFGSGGNSTFGGNGGYGTGGGGGGSSFENGYGGGGGGYSGGDGFGMGGTSYIHPSGTNPLFIAGLDAGGNRKNGTTTFFFKCPDVELSGRDTTVCAGETVDLSSLLTGNQLHTLYYGTSFGNYNYGLNGVRVVNDTTVFYIIDSLGTNCADTTTLTVFTDAKPQVEAGQDIFQFKSAPTTLNAITTGITSQASQWTLINGTATIVESTNPNTAVEDIPLGGYAFLRWTSFNESCTVSDSLRIFNVNANSVRAIPSAGKVIQEWSIPAGVHEVTARITGADGGNTNKKGGQGAMAMGTFSVTPLDTLEFVLGQSGVNSSSDGAGGGGGSGLRSSTDTLIIAGGGSGAATKNRNVVAQGGQIVVGNGQGGTVTGFNSGGGGGGLFGNGADKSSFIKGGGKGFLGNGGSHIFSPDGGYGTGGGGSGNNSTSGFGGGGGGYSGGNGLNGGGTSYIHPSGTNAILIAGLNGGGNKKMGTATFFFTCPDVELSARDTTVCSGETVDLSTLLTGSHLNRLFYGNSFGNYNFGQNSVRTVNDTTVFYIIDSLGTNCADTTMLTVFTDPRPSVEAGADIFQLQSAPISLSATTTGAISQPSQWTVIDGTAIIIDASNPNTIIENIPLESISTLRWTAINGSCTVSDSVRIFNVNANSTKTILSAGKVIQKWPIPTGINEIVAKLTGADGGNTNKKGGQGATAIATFTIIPNDTLELVLGQAGFNPNHNSDGAGGGGGSGLRTNTDTLIVVGGGGGASGSGKSRIAHGGQITAGNGQGGVSSNAGGGGGGLLGNGGSNSRAEGGKRGFLGDGGAEPIVGNGGYGVGGGGSGNWSSSRYGGGGGGYTGGSGLSGGGGSFIHSNGRNPLLIAGKDRGGSSNNGTATFYFICPDVVLSGRDTTVCAGSSLDLSTLLTGSHLYTLYYGDSFGNYNHGQNSVHTVNENTTFYVIDSLGTNCTDTTVIRVNTFSLGMANAVSPTCQSGTTSPNMDGQIRITDFQPSYTYQYSEGTTFNENNALPASPTSIPNDGIILDNLKNVNQSYTVRITNSEGCYADRVVNFSLISCMNCMSTTTFSAIGQELQQWIVPEGVGEIQVTAVGGDGGHTADYGGGKGATATANFYVSEGEELEIMVGGKGGTSQFKRNTGGGGGSGVRRKTTPNGYLLIAGGGGGAHFNIGGKGGNAGINGNHGIVAPGSAIISTSNFGANGHGGSNGYSGTSIDNLLTYTASGGGFLSGFSGSITLPADFSSADGGFNAKGGTYSGSAPEWDFGAGGYGVGGGGMAANKSGDGASAGGGGYSGGGSSSFGRSGGGAGSIISTEGFLTSLTSGTDGMAGDTAEHGLVIICFECPNDLVLSSRDTTVCTGDVVDLRTLLTGSQLHTLYYGDSFGNYNYGKNSVHTINESTLFYVIDSIGTNCSDTTTIRVDIFSPTADITDATCQPGTSTVNSDGKITISHFSTSDKYQYSIGNTFDENSAIPNIPTTIPAGGVIVDTLTNAIQNYTVRITNVAGCTVDRVVSFTQYVDRIYVKSDATGNNDGTTWEHAFTDIQAAINRACEVTEIWVAAGTYLPTENPYTSGTGNRLRTFHLSKDVQLYGGFSGTETQLSERNPTANTTILNANGGYHAIIAANLSEAAIIDGFTIQNANGNGFSTNTYAGQGFFHTNAGGVFLRDSDVQIQNCIITNNRADAGAGIVIQGTSQPNITNCLFFNNPKGHAIYAFQNANPKIINCTITDNKSGTYNRNQTATPQYINTIIYGNQTNVTNTQGCVPTFKNCVVEGSGGSSNWMINGATNLGGNLDIDPVFTDENNHDYSISACSRVLNLGDNAANLLDKDLGNQSRISNTTIDIGAYEFQGAETIIVNAGEDMIQVNNGTFQMAAVPNTSGMRIWTIESGTANIISPNSPTSMVSAVPVNTIVLLRWTEVNTSCTGYDLVQLENRCGPSAVNATVSLDDADATICQGQTVTFTAAGGNQYEFFINDISVQNGTSNTFTTDGLSDGDMVRVLVTNISGCSSYSDAIQVEVSTFPMLASFTEHVITSDFTEASDIFAIDLDQDGDVDVLSSSNSTGNFSWWENDGNESFTKRVIQQIFVNDVDVKDIDRDGDLDIVAATYGNLVTSSISRPMLIWWENDGSENFTQHTLKNASTPIGLNSISAIDIDRDGDLDFLGAAQFADQILWWENDGDEGFTERTIAGNFNQAFSIYATDVDGDGDIDVLGAAATADDIAWWENDGNEGFTEHTIDDNFDRARSVYATDVDGDGDIDVLGAAATGDDIAWWENDGNEGFTEHTIDDNFDGARSIYATDVDGDGDIDVLGAAANVDEIAWWENDGNESFTKHTIDGNFKGVRSIYVADVDGDGDMDVLGAAKDANKITWWEKELNPAPLTSSDTDNTICPGESVTFSYSGGTNYEFFVNDVSVQNGTNDSYIATSLINGDKVKVTVSNTNGCSQTSPETALVVIPEITWYRDADGDGYGDATITKDSCAMPTGYVTDNEDCDDSDANITTSGPPVINNTDGWTEAAKVLGSDVGGSDTFGYSVSISGDYAIVGAPNKEAAYIFKRSGTSWSQEAKIRATDHQNASDFGISVSISGDYAIVGAEDAILNEEEFGAAYIFKRSGTSWIQEAKILASDKDIEDHFGASVSISGDYAIVGAFGEDTGGLNVGAAYVYRRSGTSWVEEAKIQSSDKGNHDIFGVSVSISGDYVIVGATNVEAAYMFKRSGTSWVEEAKIQASDRQVQDKFGSSVSISGDYAIVGASGEDTGGSSAGAAYIFKRSGTTWIQETKIQASDNQSDYFFGSSVSISGIYAVVSADALTSFGSISGTGAAYVFKRNGTSWVEETKIQASDKRAGDLFGFSVAISGDDVIAGAWEENTRGTSAGAAYIYDLALPKYTVTCSATPPTPTASAACGGEIEGVTTTTFPITGADSTRVIWTFTDDDGNQSSAVQDVILTNFGITEVCNGIDDDCDGMIDEGIAQITWYQDSDGDGYGNALMAKDSCAMPTGYVSDNTDCDDSDEDIYPGRTWYRDEDSDGYGDAIVTLNSCTMPTGYVSNSMDCDDTTSSIYPGAPEICNGVDDNCDGFIDAEFKELGTNDFRISEAGGSGDDDTNASDPTIAYNTRDNEYLVVWKADDTDVPGIVDGEDEIFGQRYDSDGHKLGDMIRISDAGGTGNSNIDAVEPSVTYNSIDNEYLVVWKADDTDATGIVDQEFEIFGQRISNVGAEIGDNDFRISDAGGIGTTDGSASDPKVAYNSTDNEYLVVWYAIDTDVLGMAAFEFEIFGQRLNNVGAEIGDNDFRISDAGGTGDGLISTFNPDIAYNSNDNEYLVTWQADDTDATGVVDNENEIFGQRLSSTGAEIGDNDFRISDVGGSGNASKDASDASVTYNSTDNEYLVVWDAEDTDAAGIVNNEFEIFGQRLSNTGVEIGDNDFRISDAGGIGNSNFGASDPTVTYSSINNEYLVVWTANDTDANGIADNELEIYGQRLSSSGLDIGENDFRISDAGGSGNPSSGASDVFITYNSGDNEYLAVWRADDTDATGVVDTEYEIFGQILGLESLKSLIVTNTNDNGCGSLRGAVASAEAGDTITFANAINGDTIKLTSGQINLDKKLTFIGNSPDSTIVDGSGSSRIFRIGDGDTVSISSIGFHNGSVHPQNGGAIYSEGSLTLINTKFQNNSARLGGAVFSAEGTHLKIAQSVFHFNTASNDGGAICTYGGLYVTHSDIRGNLSKVGGAIYYEKFQTQPITSTISNTTISGNQAVNDGGGIFSHTNHTLLLSNSTVAFNNSGAAAGISKADGSLILHNSVVAHNEDTDIVDYDGPVVQAMNSHVMSSMGDHGVTSGNGLDPLFLQNISANQGISVLGNFRLQSCSPLINAGSNALIAIDSCDIDGDMDITEMVSIDLQDSSRIFNDVVDIGAYESKFTRGVIYVDSNAVSGDNTGQSWTHAFTKLQDALTFAQGCNRDTSIQIWVAKGTYYPDEGIGQTDDNVNNAFRMRNLLEIYGGFSGTETLLSQRNFRVNQTILSGDIDQDGINNNSNTTSLVINNNLDSTAVIDGFTLADAYRTENSSSSGGGMRNTNSDPTIRNCTFIRLTAGLGGAIFNSNSNPTTINCTFSQCRAGRGSVVLALGSSALEFIGCLFVNNSGIPGTIEIHQNSSAIFTNCTFSGNDTRGAINHESNGSVAIINSIIWNNRIGGDIGSASSSILLNGNNRTLNISHSLIQGWNPTGIGNIDGTDVNNAPLFVKAHVFEGNNVGADFRLQQCSPAINMGDNSIIGNDEVDLDGNDRIFNASNEGRVDLGAYEYQGKNTTGCDLVLSILGNSVVCPGQADEMYTIEGGRTGATYSWMMEGTGLIMRSGEGSDELMIGFENAPINARLIVTEVSNGMTEKDTINIIAAPPVICDLTNCVDSSHLTTGVLASAQVPDEFHTNRMLTSDAVIFTKDYTFRAGESIEFHPGFTVVEGRELLAEIMPCVNAGSITDDNVKFLLKKIGEEIASGKVSLTDLQSNIDLDKKGLQKMNCLLDIDNDNICDDVDPCIDIDGDGYGIGGGCAGADCYDDDASIPADDRDCDGAGTSVDCDDSDPFIGKCDADDDGIRDDRDNCPNHPNPGQEDYDRNGKGDECDQIEYRCGSARCNDGDPCTVNDQWDEDCNCVGTYEDSDRDGVCDYYDECEGYDDTRDWDGDNTPDGCDPDPACTDCERDEEGKVTLCWIPQSSDNMKTVKGDCEYLQKFFDEEGRIRGKSQCGPCECEMIGDTDSDGDGVCDRRDECPANPELTKKTECGCELLTDTCDDDGDGIRDNEDNCPQTPNPYQEDGDGDGIGDVCDEYDCITGSPCDDGDVCTENDRYTTDCQCIGIEKDDDLDGVCNVLDKCHGFKDFQDADNDGIPDGCDVQDECGSCQPDNEGRIYICKLTADREDFVNISGRCRELDFLYDEFGDFKSDLYSCGICECEMIGDTDSDGDGICDSKDECPEDPKCQ